ncbi:YtxH domain-containing protein [Nonomuraea lactucae]|uniref:YtxH domain-containing protein n=1 Tax=Nonomuraea lactucae TaxID=2249762 RepID=UPI000DE5540C|nr:YtxH domain-containing protein [Nonomuraea lactucae]
MAAQVPATWMGRMKAQAARTGQRMTPMASQARMAAAQARIAAEQARIAADQARMAAAHRIEDARYWAAPRLEEAAHRVEDQIAPKVSSMLTAAAERIDPTPTRSRRLPIMILLTGIAVGAIGYMVYRRNAQQWTEQMKDSASDASRWAGEKADQSAESADRAATTVSEKADEASRKMQ